MNINILIVVAHKDINANNANVVEINGVEINGVEINVYLFSFPWFVRLISE